MKRLFLIAFLGVVTFIGGAKVLALDIYVNPTPYSESALLGANQAAGDFSINTINSGSSAVVLDITGTSSLVAGAALCGDADMTWYVSAYIDTPYGDGYSIKVNRTSNGSGVGGARIASGSPSGYLGLSSSSGSPTLLFCGVGDLTNINLQYQIHNFKITGGWGANPSTVHYQVTGNS